MTRSEVIDDVLFVGYRLQVTEGTSGWTGDALATGNRQRATDNSNRNDELEVG